MKTFPSFSRIFFAIFCFPGLVALHAASSISSQPSGGTYAVGQPLTLTVSSTSTTTPAYAWFKDGTAVAGATNPTLKIASVRPSDAGNYVLQISTTDGTVSSAAASITVIMDINAHSIARWWDEFLLNAIRVDSPAPPVHARNLYHVSAAMWDAFWAYQPEGWTQAAPVFDKEIIAPSDWVGTREASQQQAISYAVYRIITTRFKNSPGAAKTLFDAAYLMKQYGYDTTFTGTTGNSPAAVGNRIGNAVLAATLNDGSNEANAYADVTNYTAVNSPLVVGLGGITMVDPNRWQPLALKFSASSTNVITPLSIQTFVGVNWRGVQTFAVPKPTPNTILFDPGLPPQLGTVTDAAFKQAAVDVINFSSMLDPADPATVDISPGVQLNNPLGTDTGKGRPLNPITGQPYAPNVVRRADYGRLLAEFWADGPNSETPPGHWNVIHNQVTDSPQFVRRFEGTGPILSPLEWDVRAYLALNGALHDAACVAWTLKRQVDSARPISMIRYMGSQGQSSDPSAPSYSVRGLPLVPGLIEVITTASSAAGQRHAALSNSVGKIAVRAWRGSPDDPSIQSGGVTWMLAENWMPYQKSGFVTPGFPAFISGHSTFSRAGAEVMTLLTGSPYFPGGLGSYSFKANQYLTFEQGPTADATLQWATYYDAADQAGASRLWGGIHISADDFAGRRLGSQVGTNAFLKTQNLRTASAAAAITSFSSRGRTGPGDDVMIAGFIVDGDAPQTAMLCGIGPGLANFGVTGYDVDPRITLYRSGASAAVATNDDWTLSPGVSDYFNQAKPSGTFTLSPGSRDAALVQTLTPGAYTMITGSALQESRGNQLTQVYAQRLSNVSVRAKVPTGEAVTVGFTLSAIEPAPVIIRALGPALASVGMTNALPDPVLRVYRQNPDGTSQLLATNDNWLDDDRSSLSSDAGIKSGALPLTPGSKDSALFLQLPAGTYFAQVTGANNASGLALIEIYNVR